MTEFDWRDDAEPRQSNPQTTTSQISKDPTPAAGLVPPPDGSDSDLEAESDSLVRPFILTGGRTQPTNIQLRVETLISSPLSALSAPLSFERRRIVEMCQRPSSVAEVASKLCVPIGVAHVLIADLVAEQLVTVHDHLDSNFPSRSLLERIRNGVRAL